MLARALAPALSPLPGAVVLRSDVERKTLFGIDETEKLPERAYSVETTIRVYKGLAEKARRVTAAGYSAIVDAVFALPVERSEIAKRQTARSSTDCSSSQISRIVWLASGTAAATRRTQMPTSRASRRNSNLAVLHGLRSTPLVLPRKHFCAPRECSGLDE